MNLVVDDDEVVPLSILSGKYVTIQEKVDGANVSVHFEQEWQPICQKRSGIINTGERPQYDVFRSTFVFLLKIKEFKSASFCF